MNNIEKIRQKMEGLKAGYEKIISASSTMTSECLVSMGKVEVLNKVIAFIDSLPDENNPEPYNPVYDEDYLNEKIAKATKSWEGVDVDKMLADCRGYEEKPSEDLEEAANEYAILDEEGKWKDGGKYKGFIAGAEWQKEQMMKDAVEGFIFQSEDYYLKELVAQYNGELKHGDKVKIIIVKNEE